MQNNTKNLNSYHWRTILDVRQWQSLTTDEQSSMFASGKDRLFASGKCGRATYQWGRAGASLSPPILHCARHSLPRSNRRRCRRTSTPRPPPPRPGCLLRAPAGLLHLRLLPSTCSPSLISPSLPSPCARAPHPRRCPGHRPFPPLPCASAGEPSSLPPPFFFFSLLLHPPCLPAM